MRALGSREVDLRRVERIDERAEVLLLREVVQFHKEGLPSLPQGARPIQEHPPERAGMRMPPGPPELGAERLGQVRRQELRPGRPGEGGGAEPWVMGVTPFVVAARHGVEREIVDADPVPLFVVLALPELLNERGCKRRFGTPPCGGAAAPLRILSCRLT